MTPIPPCNRLISCERGPLHRAVRELHRFGSARSTYCLARLWQIQHFHRGGPASPDTSNGTLFRDLSDFVARLRASATQG